MLTPDQIAVVTPTKGRPKQLNMLLTTLAAQSVQLGQILIADGGADQQTLVEGFADRLPVQWLACPTPGQIPQRNFALTHLAETIRAVIYFDDDIQVAPDAVEVLVAYFNAQSVPPGGVSFNLGNFPEQPDSVFRRLFLMGTNPGGRILKSGYNTPVVQPETDLKHTDWLIGGATLWRRDVLGTFRLPDLPSDWATCEDLIFSYPVSKVEPLHVCVAARADHIDEARILSAADCKKRGRAAVLWRAWFVQRNRDLSKLAFLWMNTGMVLGWAARGVRGNPLAWGYMHGTLSGMTTAMAHWIKGQDVGLALR
jgi:glycosyltransferase involved in cell wall biosynthesis